jgi:hypothetical protein
MERDRNIKALIPMPARLILAFYSLVLGITAIWLLCTELLRPDVTALPTNQQSAAVAAGQRIEALWAARFGALRGELWSDLAFTYANLDWTDRATVTAPVLDQAKTSATRATRLTPANPAVWLLLADLASRFGWQSPNPTESLKMSYYTGPYEDSLIPLRLATAARLDVSADPELEPLFQREVESILTYHPELKLAIISAYQQATAPSRHSIEEAAKRLDPAFAQNLSSGPFLRF